MIESNTNSRRRSVLINDEYVIVDESIVYTRKVFGVTIYRRVFHGTNDLQDPKGKKNIGFQKD